MARGVIRALDRPMAQYEIINIGGGGRSGAATLEQCSSLLLSSPPPPAFIPKNIIIALQEGTIDRSEISKTTIDDSRGSTAAATAGP